MEYEIFLEKAKELTQIVREKKEKSTLKSNDKDAKTLEIYRPILRYLRLVGMQHLAFRMANGEENAIYDYLSEKEQRIKATILRTKSRNKLEKFKAELDNIARLRKLDINSLVKEYASTDKDLTDAAQYACRQIAASDEYTCSTILNGGGLGFLDFESESLINEPNILLAQEILAGNYENYNKLREIAILLERKRSLNQAKNASFFSSAINRYFEAIEQLEKVNQNIDNMPVNYKSGIFKKPEKDPYVMRQYNEKREELRSYIASIINEMQRNFSNIKGSGFTQSPYFTDKNGGPISSELLILKRNAYDDYGLITQAVEEVKMIFDNPVMGDLVKTYISEMSAKFEGDIEAIYETLPENVKDADITHMSRIVYYGRGRIGEKPTDYDPKDALFDMTRRNLNLLLSFSRIYMESKEIIPEYIFSEKQLQQMEDKIFAKIDARIEMIRKR